MVKAIDKWEVDVCRQSHLSTVEEFINNKKSIKSQVTMLVEGVTLFLAMFAFVAMWVTTGQ